MIEILSECLGTLILIFCMAVTLGLIISYACYHQNMEGRKKGFRKGKFWGKDKAIDKRMYENYRHNQEYLKDTMEYHANKAFK